MRYNTKDNILYSTYRKKIRRAILKNNPIFEEWTTWRKFASWLEAHGYDENISIRHHSKNPFTPEYTSFTPRETHNPNEDVEFIAYKANDPCELIVASASTIPKLSAKLRRGGWSYTSASIYTALSKNGERDINKRKFGLIFEKVDLTNYNEDPEPFEERTINE